MVTANLKRFLFGTFYGAVRRHRLQEYIDEFVFRFNRHFWQEQILERLLSLCVGGTSAPPRETGL